jgi:hypothetical protein
MIFAFDEMELNYKSNLISFDDEDYLCQYRFWRRGYLSDDDKLFEPITKEYSKIDSAGGNFWYFLNNIPMSILKPIYRNEICNNIGNYIKSHPNSF